MSACLKLLTLCFVLSLSACSTFYSRHYTKGIFYDGMAHKAQPATHVESPATVAMKRVPDNLQTTGHKPLPGDKAMPANEKRHPTKSEKISPPAAQKFITPDAAFSSPFLKKALMPIQNKIQTSGYSRSVAGKAAFYILALILAVGILTLAIYFLPAILIPATSTFSTILLIGAIVVACVFVFLIYTLIHTLIDLFRHKKIQEEEEI